MEPGAHGQDELFAAIEGTILHSLIILERMEEKGAPVRRIINGGGSITRKSDVFNCIYANALDKPVLVSSGRYHQPWLGSLRLLASGDYASVEEAQDALYLPYTTYLPDERETEMYDKSIHYTANSIFARRARRARCKHRIRLAHFAQDCKRHTGA